MSELTTDVLVIGAGAVGCAVAANLAEAGCEVVLAGVAGPSTTASCVAAGMIAPSAETLLDPPSLSAGPLLHAGAACWSAFAERFGVVLRRSGALVLGAPEGVSGTAVSWEEARRRAPFLAGQGSAGDGNSAVHWLPDEALVDPRQALAAMENVFIARGGRRVCSQVEPHADGHWHHPGGRVAARRVVIAAGWASHRFAGLVPELAELFPIRGQILRLAGLNNDPAAPFVRGPGAYLAPQADGTLMLGATMEAGETALAPCEQVSRGLLSAAAQFAPGVEGADGEALVGIRAATADALPMVGPASRDGVWLATGLRRNGWLLAPLVAGMIADYLAGRDPGPHAAMLHPGRFGRR
jgi:glycine oxidase